MKKKFFKFYHNKPPFRKFDVLELELWIWPLQTIIKYCIYSCNIVSFSVLTVIIIIWCNTTMRIDTSFLSNQHSLQGASSTTRKNIAAASRVDTFASISPVKALTGTKFDQLLEGSCLGFCQEQYGISLVDTSTLLLAGLKYLATHPIFLQEEPPTSFSQASSNILQQSERRTLAEKVEFVSQAVANLNDGESYFIGAGFEGHPLLVKVTKTHSSYDLFFYDASRGSEVRQGGVITPEGSKSFPYIQFANVSREELFLPQQPTLFFEVLLKRATEQSANPGQQPWFEEYLSICLPFFHRKKNVDDLLKEHPNLLISTEKGRSPQQRGYYATENSAIKSFHCMFLDTLKDQKRTKQWNLALDFFTLGYGYTDWMKSHDNTELRENRAYRLNLAMKRFLVQLSDYQEWIKEEDFIRAVATITAMQEQVEEYLNTPKERTLSPIEKVRLLPQENIERLETLQAVPKSAITIGGTKSTAVLVQPNLGKNCSWSDLPAVLSEASRHLNPLDPVGTILQYQCLIGNLRHLKTLAPSLEAQEALRTQQQLTHCFQIYLDALHSQKGDLTQQDLNSAMETTVLQFLLAKGNAPTLADYGIDFTHYRKVLEFSYHLSQDHEAMEHTTELLEFLNKQDTTKILFNFVDPCELTLNQWLKGHYAEAEFHLQSLPKQVQDFLRTQPETAQEIGDWVKMCGIVSPQQGNSPRLAAFLHVKQTALWSVELTLGKHRLNKQKIYSCERFLYPVQNPNVISVPSFFGRESWIYCLSKPIEKITGMNYSWETRIGVYGMVPLLTDPEKPPAGFSEDCAKTFKTEIISRLKRSENDFLPSDTNTFRRYLTALCAEGAQVSVILQDLANELAGIPQDLIASILFLLFRTFKAEKQIKSPLLDQLRLDPNILLRLGLIVDRVFGVWSVDAQMREPLLTVLRLYGQLCYSSMHYQPEQTQALDLAKISLYTKWVQETSDDPQYSSLCLLTKMALLLAPNFKDLSTEQKVDLFLTAVEMKSKKSRFIHDNEAFYLMLKRYEDLYDNWIDLFTHQEASTAFAYAVALRVDPAFIPSNTNPPTHDSLQITCFNHAETSCIIHLTALEVRLATGQLWCTPEFESQITPGLERLRPNQPLPNDRVYIGDSYTFMDPKWGFMRVSRENTGEEKVERFKDGVWQTYYSPQELNDKTALHLNHALTFDHIAFINNETQILSIYSTEAKLLYQSNTEGALEQMDSQQKGTGFFFSKTAVPPSLLAFEVLEAICLFEHTDGSKKIYLPRYSEKALFAWDQKHSRFIYCPNPSYYLNPTSVQFTWGFNRSLSLLSNSRGEAVAVPCGTVHSGAFEKNCRIDVPLTNRDRTQNSLRYVVFDVDLGRLHTNGLNENLFLALTLLAKKEYVQALEAIKNISLSDIPNEETWKLLRTFALTGDRNEKERWSDSSPLRQIVIFKTYLAIYRLRPFDPNLKSGNLKSGLKLSYETYLRAPQRIQKKVKVSRAEELSIRSLLNHSHDMRVDFLQGKPQEFEFAGENSLSKLSFLIPLNYDPWKDFASSSLLKYFFSAGFIDSYREIKETKPAELDRYIYYLAHSKAKDHLSNSQKYALFAICHLRKEGLDEEFPTTIPAETQQREKWFQILRNAKPKLVLIFFDTNRVNKIEPSFGLPVLRRTPRDVKREIEETLIYKKKSLEGIPECDTAYGLLKTEFLQTPQEEEKPIPEENPLVFRTPREARRAFYDRARQLAKKRIENKPRLKDESPQALQQLQAALENQVIQSTDQEKKLGDYISTLSNRPLADVHGEAHRIARSVGLGKPLVTIEDVCRAVGDAEHSLERLHQLNKHLTKKEIKTLLQTAVLYMAEVSHRRHVSWILGKVKTGQPPDEIAYWLSMERYYTSTQDTFTLFCEWISGLRFKPAQKIFIDRCQQMILEGKNYIFQLMMGDGKSTMIFPTIAEAISNQTGRTFCMLAHHSQRTSALGNFRKFQSSRFKKDIVLIEASLTDLNNLATVKELIHRFNYAMENHLAIFMPSIFPQILLLQFALQCDSHSYRHDELLFQLATLIDLLQTKAIFCNDEVDIVLLNTTDTRVPVGERIPLSGEQIDMIGVIYESLLSDELKNIVRLEENKQTLLKEEDYWKKVIPVLAESVFNTFLNDVKENEQAACLRHLMHQIPLDDQILADNPETVLKDIFPEETRQNVAFLQELFRKKETGSEQEKQQVKCIGRARQIFKEYLPQALSRKHNQDYGSGCTKPGQQSNGNVVHYNYVDTPSGTEFGDKVFKGLLEMQMAVQRRIDPAELNLLKDKYRLPMMTDAARKGIHPSQTPEGRQFERMTNIPILDLDKPGQMKKALDYVNADPFRRLAIRKETTGHHVWDHRLELRMCANDLERIPSSYIAASGTLYNVNTLGQADTVETDEALEGLIYHAIQSQTEEGLSKLVTIDQNNLEGILAYAKSLPHESKSRWHAHLDAAGSFEDDVSSDQVAKRLLDFFAQHPEFQKEAVIYCHRFADGEKFVVLKQGSTEPIVLFNTTAEEVTLHVEDNSRIFYYVEEKDGTGLDWYLEGTKDNPYFATMNLGPQCITRDFLQFLIRLRRYLLNHQGVHFLISKAEQTKFEQSAKDIHAVLTHLENKEADAIETQTSISYQDQINGILKWKGINELVQAVLKKQQISKLFDKFKPYLFSEKKDNDLEAIRIQEKEIDTLGILQKQHAEAFTELFPDCVAERDKILEKAAANPYFSKQAHNFSGHSADHQVQVQTQQQTQTVNQNLNQIQNQIQQQLMQHRGGHWHRTHSDIDWISKWPGGPPSDAQTKVQDFLTAKLASGSTVPFAPCFPPHLHLTWNLRRTSDIDISVMHPRFKKTHFMLIVKNRENKRFEGTLLSKFDFDRLRARLQTDPVAGAWLINLQGFEEIRTSEAGFLPQNDEVETLIWYANLFNGNTTYLLDHLDLTRKIAQEKKGEIADRMGDYLLLKNVATIAGIEQVVATGLVGKDRYPENPASEVLCSDRRKLNAQLLRPVDTLSDNEATTIDPSFVRLLPDEKIPLLNNPERIRRLDSRQLQLIEPHQLQWVKDERLNQLTNPTLIQALEDPVRIQALGTGSQQLKHLTEKQLPSLTDAQLFALPTQPQQFIKEPEHERIRNYILQGDYPPHKLKEWHNPYLPPKPVPEEVESVPVQELKIEPTPVIFEPPPVAPVATPSLQENIIIPEPILVPEPIPKVPTEISVPLAPPELPNELLNAPSKTPLLRVFQGIIRTVTTLLRFGVNLSILAGITVATPFSRQSRSSWWRQLYQTFGLSL